MQKTPKPRFLIRAKIPLLTIMCFLLSGAIPSHGQVSFSKDQTAISFSRDANLIRIHAVATIPVHPNTLYILMKVQSEKAELAQAIKDNKNKVEKFCGALTDIGIQRTSIRLKNFVVTPLITGAGISFAQNMVITVEEIDQKPAGELNQLISRVQDLGAQHGSHCITCIGSG